MFRIDSHQHFWKYNPAEYEWIDETKRAIRRDFLPADLRLEIGRAGVNAVISVQARQTLEETEWLLELANGNEFIRGVVGWAPLAEPDIEVTLAWISSNPKLRSLRHVLQDEPDPEFMLREDFNRGLSKLKNFKLAYDILIFERHLPQTIQLVDRHPHQTFILDHLAKPRVKYRELSPWRENLRELAKRPNVWCKISGLATEAEYTAWTSGQLWPYIETALSAFGPERAMFGSDWPVCLLAVNYCEWISTLEEATRSLSAHEQERLWSGAAIEAYGLT